MDIYINIIYIQIHSIVDAITFILKIVIYRGTPTVN